ncbi:MAG: oxidoreductase [Alphaproteobacteria bacterium]|nr:oxidoreductase [Alphaproteobacteria bacterium]MBU2377895.1 oxidoreductase [Alphaproteobacteria bacterium]
MAGPINVALVGYGFAGKTFHAPLISACAGLRLHTVVSSRAADVHADWPDVRVVPSLDDALADPAIDLLVIATPDPLHAEQAKAALHAGKAVVVDKPFALTVADARGVVDLAGSKGLLLSVFQNRRWDADFLALKMEIEAGRLGRIVTFESRFDRYRPIVRDRWREAEGAGVWFDLGPHLIDQALILFGRPLGITLDLAIQRDGGKSPDWAHAVLRYEQTRVILNAAMMIAAPDVRFAVHGTKASFLSSGLDPQEDQLKAGMAVGASGWGVDPAPATRVEGDSGERTPVDGPPGDYPPFYARIAAALRGVGPNPVPPEQALAVMEVIEAGVESARLRQEVAL